MESVKMTNVTVIYVRGKHYSHTKTVLRDTEFLRIGMSCAYEFPKLRWEYDMKSHMELFVALKGKTFLQFCDHHWMCHFGFCIDMIEHRNELNSNLYTKTVSLC
jgi:hypothetical protein